MANEAALTHKVWPAMWNGLRGHCPKCGVGKLFHHYSEVVEHCSHCGEPLERYRVGLLLPFVLIMIVAYVLIFVMVEMELHRLGSPLAILAVLVPLAIIIPLLILPAIKGTLVGLLWARNLSDELDE